MSDNFGKELVQSNGDWKSLPKGVVHGHIHNYNNLTYIHGHIHKNDIAENTEPVGPQDALDCAQYENCEHFEFINCHSLNLFGENGRKVPAGQVDVSTLEDGHSAAQIYQEKNITQQLIEPCCDFKRDNVPKSFNHSLDFLDCELTCDSPMASEEDQDEEQSLEEGLKQEKVQGEAKLKTESPNGIDFIFSQGYNEDNVSKGATKQENTNGLSNTFNTIKSEMIPDTKQDYSKLTIDVLEKSKISEITEVTPKMKKDPTSIPDQQTIEADECSDDKDNSVDDPLFEDICSQCLMNYESVETPHFHHNSHSHVLNTSTDMKILTDLSSISNLYDFLGKCEYPQNDSTKDDHVHVSMNLLHSTLKGYNDHNHDETNYNTATTSGSSSVINANNNFCDHYHDHRYNYQQSIGPSRDVSTDSNSDLAANTINFNWSFNTNNAPIQCQWDDCTQPYENLLDLQTHVLKDHVTLQEPDMLSCKWLDCDFNTSDPCCMVNHVNGKHGINFDVKILDNSTVARQASAHKQLHEESQLHVCKWRSCSDVFNSSKDLNEHIEDVHVPKGLSSYICEWQGCQKTFVQRQKLLRHLKVHTKYKPFKCHECGKCFNTQDILTQHLRIHSGERPFKCHLCPKSYSSSSSLRIHLRAHSGEKPLSCPICSKRFNESSNLAKHIRTHGKECKANCKVGARKT
ncbi:protein AZF1 [Kluyveromyces marxianus]|uniref:Protein AZF1 n=1 Tax=Kluyveromyces marxianus TaxID=4911 RepID=A0ABX6EWK4_KLUMA|nr:protein AZF1 [Kluyveromyces marxianus]